jgi:DNA segregation ATPase FtsK/SpoIIIE, S-DNA-T family
MANSVSKSGKGLGNLTPGKKPWLAIVSGIVGVLLLISLIDYNPANYHSVPPSGSSPLLGKIGVVLARYLFGIFGLSAWLLPWMLATISFLAATKSATKEKVRKISTIAVAIVTIGVLANIRDHSLISDGEQTIFPSNAYEHGAGGSIGAILYSGLPIQAASDDSFGGFLRVWMGALGTSILMVCLLTGCIFIHFSMEPLKFVAALVGIGKKVKDKIPENLGAKKSPEAEQEQSTEDDVKPTKNKESKKTWRFPLFGKRAEDDLLFGDVSLQKSSTEPNDSPSAPEKMAKTEGKIEKSLPKEELLEQSEPEEPDAPVSDESPSTKDEVAKEEETQAEVETDPTDGMDGFKVVRAAKPEKAVDLFPERKGDYHFPTLDLLMDPPEEESSADEDHMIKAKRLKETLSQFKIEVEMGEVHTGPVITRYDVHPAPGVKVEKIANLDKNLAMALKADSVRILAPVPGKGCVGIEVPNAKPAAVCLKEILQSKAWVEAGAEIPIVLGKEASGRPLVADLTKMPHLLVAGSTGSGKTVCINAVVASLCYHSSPEDVRFIMVDPKIVEMKVYNDLPHMLIPVVTDPKKVPGALKWLLIEMERRYQIFSKVGVRNIAGFNAKILKDKEEKEKAQLLDAEMTPEERAALSTIEVPRDDEVLEIPENKLPYIVCIIDELADLMMVAQADVETGIARLAQLARAAGIHLIIATQRPSVNVITGVIKANLPSRISFRVASFRDSQTILDGKGAEALLGRGDMLFIPPGSSTFARAQGAFVSDEEINGIVDYLKVNGPPQIIEEVRDQIESADEGDVLGEGGGDSDEDPMIRKAIEIIRTTKRASTSNLQRKLSIGYNRAARIMDELEDRGVVGADIPGQGREILLDL